MMKQVPMLFDQFWICVDSSYFGKSIVEPEHLASPSVFKDLVGGEIFKNMQI